MGIRYIAFDAEKKSVGGQVGNINNNPSAKSQMVEIDQSFSDAEKKSVGAQVGHGFQGNQHTESLLVDSDQTAKAKRDGTTATKLAKDFGVSVGQFKHSVRIGKAIRSWQDIRCRDAKERRNSFCPNGQNLFRTN